MTAMTTHHRTTMDSPALLPCPFCESTDDDLSCDVDEYGRACVVCGNCAAEGPCVVSHIIGSDAAIEQAAAAWNQHRAWQSIETAPRDGTKFLAWDGDELLIAWWCDGGRWISDNLQQYHPGEYENPTHWQPLPSPPPITP